MTAVRIPVPLRRWTGGVSLVQLRGSTVAECLAEFERCFPGARPSLVDEKGELLSSVSLYLNGQDIRYLKRLQTPVGSDDELMIVLAVAGGSSAEFWVLSRGGSRIVHTALMPVVPKGHRESQPRTQHSAGGGSRG